MKNRVRGRLWKCDEVSTKDVNGEGRAVRMSTETSVKQERESAALSVSEGLDERIELMLLRKRNSIVPSGKGTLGERATILLLRERESL